MPAQTKTRSSSNYALKATAGNKALLYAYTQVCIACTNIVSKNNFPGMQTVRNLLCTDEKIFYTNSK